MRPLNIFLRLYTSNWATEWAEMVTPHGVVSEVIMLCTYDQFTFQSYSVKTIPSFLLSNPYIGAHNLI